MTTAGSSIPTKERITSRVTLAILAYALRAGAAMLHRGKSTTACQHDPDPNWMLPTMPPKWRCRKCGATLVYRNDEYAVDYL